MPVGCGCVWDLVIDCERPHQSEFSVILQLTCTSSPTFSALVGHKGNGRVCTDPGQTGDCSQKQNKIPCLTEPVNDMNARELSENR